MARPDSSGLAEQGTALAQARTSTFEVLPYHQYIAARAYFLFHSDFD
jgi:hypothetical protein